MRSSTITPVLLAGLMTLLKKVTAHGTASGIIADGIFYEGYNPSYQYIHPLPKTVGWATPQDLGNTFIPPASFASPDVICHLGATPAQMAAPVKAGGTVEVMWTPWPTSHHGPVIDYLANCNGPCETVDKTKLQFFKIDQGGLINDAPPPGSWATDQLIANNNTWSVKIPVDIAPGNYVLRHEIIALHAAGAPNGAQDYPFCFNLAISGTGTATPAGALGTALYKATDPGIYIDIYSAIKSYVIPGPALYSGAAPSMVQTMPAKATASSPGIYNA